MNQEKPKAEKFKNPPLVELVAELRWRPHGINLTPGADSNRDEELFMRFGAKISQEGFSQFERVVPPGFPLTTLQPVYRYRRGQSEQGTSLYQLGPGLFSANITPPYNSWNNFRPIVESGIINLIACRDETEKEKPFNTVLLRYIDAFDSKFMENTTLVDFMAKLGFEIKLPTSIRNLSYPQAIITPILQFGIQLKDDFNLTVSTGNGNSGGQTALILDMTLSTLKSTECDIAQVMQVLNHAHDIIHSIFIDITKPIEKLMEPIGDDVC